MVSELHKHALRMGVFGKYPLDGIEVDFRIARILNHEFFDDAENISKM